MTVEQLLSEFLNITNEITYRQTALLVELQKTTRDLILEYNKIKIAEARKEKEKENENEPQQESEEIKEETTTEELTT